MSNGHIVGNSLIAVTLIAVTLIAVTRHRWAKSRDLSHSTLTHWSTSSIDFPAFNLIATISNQARLVAMFHSGYSFPISRWNRVNMLLEFKKMYIFVCFDCRSPSDCEKYQKSVVFLMVLLPLGLFLASLFKACIIHRCVWRRKRWVGWVMSADSA